MRCSSQVCCGRAASGSHRRTAPSRHAHYCVSRPCTGNLGRAGGGRGAAQVGNSRRRAGCSPAPANILLLTTLSLLVSLSPFSTLLKDPLSIKYWIETILTDTFCWVVDPEWLVKSGSGSYCFFFYFFLFYFFFFFFDFQTINIQIYGFY